MMECGLLDIQIDQNADFNLPLTFLEADGITPVDITGATATAQVRQKYSDVEEILDFTFTNGATSGVFTLSVAKSILATLPFPYPTAQKDIPIKCVWDLFFVDTNGNVTGIAGSTTRLLKGIALIIPSVTR